MNKEQPMKDGHCPKCGSTDVYCSNQASNRHLNFSLNIDPDADSFPVLFYLCLNCHYVELYADDNTIAVPFAKSKPINTLIPRSGNWKKGQS